MILISISISPLLAFSLLRFKLQFENPIIRFWLITCITKRCKIVVFFKGCHAPLPFRLYSLYTLMHCKLRNKHFLILPRGYFTSWAIAVYESTTSRLGRFLNAECISITFCAVTRLRFLLPLLLGLLATTTVSYTYNIQYITKY